MTAEPISEEIRRFILTTIASVPFLEALLVYRSARGKPLQAAEIARRLYLGEQACVTLLESLRDAGIIAPVADAPFAFRYEPSSPELGRILDQLADLYAMDLIEVTNIIHSRTSRKAQQFADAFKWRRDS